MENEKKRKKRKKTRTKKDVNRQVKLKMVKWSGKGRDNWKLLFM